MTRFRGLYYAFKHIRWMARHDKLTCIRSRRLAESYGITREDVHAIERRFSNELTGPKVGQDD